MSKRKCEYAKCISEEINNRRIYGVKGAIFIIGWIYLNSRMSDFTFVSLALYIVPVYVDNTSAILGLFKMKKLLAFDYITKAISTAILFLCFSGMTGYLIELKTSFIVNNNAVMFSSFNIPKQFISAMLLLNIFEAIVLMVFVPSKNESIAAQSKRQLAHNSEQLITNERSVV